MKIVLESPQSLTLENKGRCGGAYLDVAGRRLRVTQEQDARAPRAPSPDHSPAARSAQGERARRRGDWQRRRRPPPARLRWREIRERYPVASRISGELHWSLPPPSVRREKGGKEARGLGPRRSAARRRRAPARASARRRGALLRRRRLLRRAAQGQPPLGELEREREMGSTEAE